MLEVLFVALGGAIGSVARYLLGGWFAARFGAAFPYGTFVINVTGSFIIGLFLAYAQDRVSLSPYWRLFFAVGFVVLPPQAATSTTARVREHTISGADQLAQEIIKQVPQLVKNALDSLQQR